MSPFVQFSYRTRMKSGCQSSSLPSEMSVSRSSASRAPLRMYHCRVDTISSGRSPFSKNFTGWLKGLETSSSSPDSCSNSTMRFFALKTVLPAISAYAALAASVTITSGASGTIRPSLPMMVRFGRSSSRHQMMSVTSPKVQIIAMPEPLSGWASGCGSTGTSTPNTGLVTVVPNSGW